MLIERLQSFIGLLMLIGIGWLLSADRRSINLRVLIWGVLLQLLIGLFIFLLPGGSQVFLFLNDGVVAITRAAGEGICFLFGPLALPPEESGSLGFILAIQGLLTIVFFGALMGLLYYWRVIPFLIELFASLFTRWMKVSGAESLCVASNIFVGIESSLAVRPYLGRMTLSELHTILTAMMATIASSVLGLYVLVLKDQFPTIAGHLISASLMSAPAALVMSKLMLPEKESPETLGMRIKVRRGEDPNAVMAIINGAQAGGKMVWGIMTLLIAVLGLAGLVNMLLELLGRALPGVSIKLTLEGILGYVGYPFAFLIGVNPSDALEVGRLIGERVMLTELKSYQDLNLLLAQGALTSPRSAGLAAYALCGFAHIASLAIFVGGVSALVPERTGDLARVGVRALVAATLACLMTACVAGLFMGESILLTTS